MISENKRRRSPNFPYLDLGDAIGKLRTIYEKDKRAVTSGEAILEHMGYSSKEGNRSGSAGRALSAMRQYGLIEEVNGNYRVSDSGFHIVVLPEGDPKRLNLIRQAATKPVMFEKILSLYSYDLPSDTTLRSHLITEESFNPDSAKGFIRNLRSSIEFASIDDSAYNGSSIDEETDDAYVMQPESTQSNNLKRPASPQVIIPGTTATLVERADHIFSYQLSFPRNIRAEVRIYGGDLRKADIVRLQNEVGDLAGAFDEDDVTETNSTQ